MAEIWDGEEAVVTTNASIIGSEPLLRGLPATQVQRLAELATQVSAPSGTRLFEEGGTARHFWLIAAGRVALDTLVPGHGLVTIETLGRGDVMGLSWLTPPYVFTFGALCLQPVQAYRFDAAGVRAACDRDPGLGYALFDRFLAVAAHRLQVTRARLVQRDLAATL
jgi:CRP/FNR family transcriptional regulator, cyclic AMP receptor protein